MGAFVTAPSTDAAREWQGWGTALKPSWEPICKARKPLIGTVAANVLAHGTGALNIDGCRIEGAPPSVPQPIFNSPTGRTYGMKTGEGRNGEMSSAQGRWPANLCHDGSEEVLAEFPASKDGVANPNAEGGAWHGQGVGGSAHAGFGGGGSAARFFGQFQYGEDEWEFAKSVHAARSAESRCGSCGSPIATGRATRFLYCPKTTSEERGEGNDHPTVKPTSLMRWLCRMVTPKGGTVLDPFMGSGSTMIAADQEQFHAIGCELDPAYIEIACNRIRREAGLFADLEVC
jgi:hypothetical protein